MPVKLIGDMVKANQKLITVKHNSTKESQRFGIVKGSTSSEAHVVFQDGAELGILDERTCKALDSFIPEALDALKPHQKFEIYGQAEMNAIRAVISKSHKASQAVIRIDIMINGPADLAEEVSSCLSVQQVWLQRPSATRLPYRNPQTLSFPGMETGDIQAPESGVEMSVEGKKQSVETFQETLAGVYETLKRDKDLIRIEGDGRLKTALLR